MTAEEQSAPGRRVVVLYAYNGSQFQGLERSKGLKTVEGTLLSAIASIAGQSDPAQRVSLVNISRASTTEEGEHAARQYVLTLVLLLAVLHIVGTDSPLPTAVGLNAILPEGIKVFNVVQPGQSFSARRTCDGRTYEYLIPTYVFAPPPIESHYCYPEQEDDEEEEVYPADNLNGPPGGLFTTMKRNLSVKRSKSSRSYKSLNRSKSNKTVDENVPAMPTDSITPVAGNQNSVTEKAAPAEPISPPPSPPTEKRNPIRRFLDTLTRNKKKRDPQEPEARPTLNRALSYGKDDEAAYTKPVPVVARQQSFQQSGYGSPPNVSFSTSAPAGADDEGILSTLKRSMSRKSARRREFDEGGILDNDGYNEEDEAGPQYYDPLVFPTPSEEDLSKLRRYRITESQMKALTHIAGIYNGTHNWHNYIPGAKYEDPRCYMRILNIEVSQPEEHAGMEWVRIKVQSKAFARFQVRKMIALAIMVIRTNTPRSVVANSFGFARIEIPEAPAHCLILDQPHYDTYNSDAARRNDPAIIDFEPHFDEVTKFRHSQLHDPIYRQENDTMPFEQWLRSIDSYSFLYTFFLNQRGVIRPRNSYVRVARGDEERPSSLPPAVQPVDGIPGGDGSLGRNSGLRSDAVPTPDPTPKLFDPEPAAV
ncbi:tRNA pseudouridine synthase 1 [Borealophlyctis nickersoniae]|nr:tRNA pseudouridine synthase 1 [Borealophlyctis nickersoniae]